MDIEQTNNKKTADRAISGGKKEHIHGHAVITLVKLTPNANTRRMAGDNDNFTEHLSTGA